VPVRGIQLSQARDIVACQRKHLLLVGGDIFNTSFLFVAVAVAMISPEPCDGS
jgi:hypothetical protein